MVVIKYKLYKKGIYIFVEPKRKKKFLWFFMVTKTFPSDFRKWFLIELAKKFDLYEDRNFENKMNFLTVETIEKSAHFTPIEIEEFKRGYILDKVRHITFEEYLDMSKVGFANIHVFPKGKIISKEEKIERHDGLLAVIDLQPDGDDCIWITTSVESSIFTKLVDEYNLKNEHK